MLIFFVLHNMFLYNPPPLTLSTKILSEAGFVFSSLEGETEGDEVGTGYLTIFVLLLYISWKNRSNLATFFRHLETVRSIHDNIRKQKIFLYR